MDGITILNQTEIMVTPEWLDTIVFISGITVAITAMGSILSIIIENDISFKISTILLIFSFFICFISTILINFIEEPTGKYIYDCTIDENASLTDFYEKYEVIEVNGQIWTIKEKDGD